MGSIEVDRTVSSSARHASDATATRAKVYEYYRAANESRWDDVVEFFHEDAVLLVHGHVVGPDVVKREAKDGLAGSPHAPLHA